MARGADAYNYYNALIISIMSIVTTARTRNTKSTPIIIYPLVKATTADMIVERREVAI